MNLLMHIQTVFYALLKAQLVLSPLLFYHKHLVTRKHVAAGFLWQIQKVILLFLVSLTLFFIAPLTFDGNGQGRGSGTSTRPGLLTGTAAAEKFFPGKESALAGALKEETAGRQGILKPAIDITAILRVVINVLICLSVCGLAWFLFRLLHQARVEYGLKKRAPEIRCLKRVQVIYSRELTIAFTSGIFKKRIFLPYDMARRNLTHKAVLAHEINHIRQGDLIWLFLESVLFHCFWYSWFARQLLYCGIHLRELRSDQAASRRFKADTYLYVLLETGARQLEPAGPGFLASSWVCRHNRGYFTERVKYLLTAGSRPGKTTKALLALLIVCSLVLSLGAEKTPGLGQTTKQPAVERLQPAAGIPEAPPAAPPFTLHLQAPLEIGQLHLEPYTAIPLLWPIQGGKGKISSNFGLRKPPLGKGNDYHRGLDIAGIKGTQVFALADGTVTETGFKPEGPGRFLLITHGNGYASFYGQLDAVLVKPGDTVHQGDVIGRLGSSGLSTGPHLHLEIRYLDKPLDPLLLLKAGGDIIYKE